MLAAGGRPVPRAHAPPHAAWLLLWATLGGIVLNNLLKQFFDRPRPQVFSWGTHALTTSFPSGTR
jgi:membrane-associated phospholipid phosphatase